MNDYYVGVCFGVVIGMFLHNLILQIAYKLGIVEYKGVKEKQKC